MATEIQDMATNGQNVQYSYTSYAPTHNQDSSANVYNANTTNNGNGVVHSNNIPRRFDYGGNPLAHAYTGESARLPPFAGYLQPGGYRPPKINIANPAPLGLFAFALTTFVLSLLNVQVRHVKEPNIIVSLAFAYGGLVQLLAGMCSYGGFWISFAIVLTPGGFHIMDAYNATNNGFDQALGFFLIGWFIFTFILWLCTLRSSVVFCLLFGSLWLTFLLLAIAYLKTPDVAGGTPNLGCQKAGGVLGLVAAFSAFYVALEGLADDSNSFFLIPVFHFPWSVKGRERREKKTEEAKQV